jgi:hypothetical protein
VAGDKMDSKEFVDQWQAVPDIPQITVCRTVFLKTGDAIFSTDYGIVQDEILGDEVRLYYERSLIAIAKIKNVKSIRGVLRERVI